MNFGIDENGKMISIVDSRPKIKYKCPICGKKVKRRFNKKEQAFIHDNDIDDINCETQEKILISNAESLMSQNKSKLESIYNKNFDSVKIEMSDTLSEEGYPLTKEQMDIINSTEDRIKISATAGSSKTTTLYYYAKKRPDKKILYLVYNAAMKKEAELTFGKLDHVTIKTVHGLAYQYVGWQYKNKLTFNYNALDVLNDLHLNMNSEIGLAVKVHDLLNDYMLSDKEKISEIKFQYDNKKEKEKVLSLAKKLWDKKKSLDNDIKIEHDFYLKLYQLQKKDLSDKFDIVMLDEAQDSNLLTLDIVNNSNTKGMVMVGDPYQQMYAWRKALDIMQYFDAKTYRLSTSFRVSQSIANVSNMLIKDVFNQDLGMTGFNKNQKIVDRIDRTKQYTLIARTNATLLSEAIDTVLKGKKIFFEGGFNSYRFNDIRDAYYFSKTNKSKNPLFSKFDDYYDMKDYAKDNEDIELLSIISAINKYSDDIPYLINKVKDSEEKDKTKADIIMTTAHKSKGATYTNVLLADDFFDIADYYKKTHILGIGPKNTAVDLKELKFKAIEEAHIIYVAITRAKGEIEFFESLKKYLLLRSILEG